ncbi:MAG: TetR/AcrR family transcriptional regulator [Parvibaculum sp.]|nr:TetR/AcrR family transcriptional regulator [Parvibaculum sp.]
MTKIDKQAAAETETTPAPSRGQARREDILRAASDLLIDEGYARFSARGVAGRAGIRLSHVQYYFAHADDMIVMLLDRFIAEYGDAVRTQFHNASGTPEKRLRQALSFLLNDPDYRDRCSIFMAEVASLAARNDTIAEALTRYYMVYQGALEALLSEINPALKGERRAVRARQCLALIEGSAQTSRYMTARFVGEANEPASDARDLTKAILRLISTAQ